MKNYDDIRVGDIIQSLLNDRGMTVVDLERVSGIPVTTLYSLIKRNNASLTLGNFLQICSSLNVAPNYFWDAFEVQMPVGMTEQLANDLLSAYCKADPDDQQVVRLILRKYLPCDSSLSKIDD